MSEIAEAVGQGDFEKVREACLWNSLLQTCQPDPLETAGYLAGRSISLTAQRRCTRHTSLEASQRGIAESSVHQQLQKLTLCCQKGDYQNQ